MQSPLRMSWYAVTSKNEYSRYFVGYSVNILHNDKVEVSTIKNNFIKRKNSFCKFNIMLYESTVLITKSLGSSTTILYHL